MQNRIVYDWGKIGINWCPEKFIARKDMISHFDKIMSPAKQGYFSIGLYVYGTNGSGKSSTVRTYMKKNFAKQHVYLNCFDQRKNYELLHESVEQITGRKIFGRPVYSQLRKRFEKSIHDKGKMIVILDRCELLDNSEIIEYILQQGCGIVFISQKSLMDSKLKFPTDGSFVLQEMAFSPFEKYEIADALTERADMCLNPDTYDEELFSKIAELSNGNIKDAVMMFVQTVTNAVNRNADRVSIDDVNFASELSKNTRMANAYNQLSSKAKIILELVREHQKVHSGSLFKMYTAVSNDYNERGYRRAVEELIRYNFVSEFGSTKGRVLKVA